MRARSLPHVVALLALLMTACGGSGEGDSTSTLTKERFIQRGDELCAQLDSRMDELFATFIPTLPERAEQYSQVVRIGRDFLSRFRALRAPESERDVQADAASSYERAIGLLERGVAAAKGSDLQGSNDLFKRGFAALAEGDATLGDAGFEICPKADTTRVRFTLPPDEVQGFSAEKKAYLEKAEAVCTADNRKLKPLEALAFGTGIPSLDTWKRFLTSALPIFRDMVDAIRRSGPPAADASTIERIASEYDEALTAAEQAQKAATEGDGQGFDAAMATVSEHSRAGDELAEEYGFIQCREAA